MNRRRWIAAIALTIVGLLLSWFAVGAVWGVPGPEPIRRYSNAELDEAEAIALGIVHDVERELREQRPDSCFDQYLIREQPIAASRDIFGSRVYVRFDRVDPPEWVDDEVEERLAATDLPSDILAIDYPDDDMRAVGC